MSVTLRFKIKLPAKGKKMEEYNEEYEREEAIDTDFYQEKNDTNSLNDGCDCSSGCMDCLSMSWKDFM